MKYEEITIEDAKGKYKHLWMAFKLQFPIGKDHEFIRKMVEVGVSIEKGLVRDESLDPLVEELEE